MKTILTKPKRIGGDTYAVNQTVYSYWEFFTLLLSVITTLIDDIKLNLGLVIALDLRRQ